MKKVLLFILSLSMLVAEGQVTTVNTFNRLNGKKFQYDSLKGKANYNAGLNGTNWRSLATEGYVDGKFATLPADSVLVDFPLTLTPVTISGHTYIKIGIKPVSATDSGYVTPAQKAIWDAGGGGGTSDADVVITRGTITSAASVDFDLSTYTGLYRKLWVEFYSVVLQTSTANLYARLSNDGTTFLTTASYGYVRDLAVNGQSTSGVSASYATQDHIELYTNVDVGAGKYLKFTVEVEDPNNAAIFPQITGSVNGWEAAVGKKINQFGAWFETAGTLKGFRIYPSTGLIVSGGWILHGLKN